MMTDRLPPIETDPLGAIRKELLNAAWRKKARDDRRRRMATVASALMLMFVSVVGGAGALGIDFPLIGDALEGLVAGRQEAERDENRDPTLPKAPADLKPGEGNVSEPLRFAADAGGTAVAAAYLNRNDDVCFVLAGQSSGAGAAGCMSPLVLARRVDAGVAYLQAIHGAPSLVVTGYVSPEIENLVVRGPGGQLDVRLGSPWTPEVAGASPLRPFIATRNRGGQDHFDPAQQDVLLDVRNYSAEVHLRDGRTIKVQP
jgi:hypothetical protein